MSGNRVYNLDDQISFDNSKQILINTGHDQNMIQLVKNDKKAYELYKTLLENDYVLYGHEDHISKFYKREHVSELSQMDNLIHYNGVFYTIEEPSGRKVNELIPKRLLVLFTCMPGTDYYSSSLIDRMFPRFFDGIEKNLVKNLYVMRFMDLNCSHGSHYVNTINFNDYETAIQNAILKVISNLDINKENVVLYGASKGGTGALLHGSALDIKALAVDPILHLGEYNNKNDLHFLKNMRDEDVTHKINHYLNDCKSNDKYIICSRNVKFNYEQIQNINKDKIKIMEMVDDMITSHPEVSRNPVPEQLMILNMLYSF